MTPTYQLGRLLNSGGWGNGDVYEALDSAGRKVIVKTYRGRRTWIGRILISRERRAYERLRGLSGMVEILPSDSSDTLVLEHIDAQAIAFAVNADNCAHVRWRLLKVASQMHAARVYHLDLRNRGNILVDKNNNPYIIDFASALIFKSNRWPVRLVERLCVAFDRYGLSKWVKFCDSHRTT